PIWSVWVRRATRPLLRRATPRRGDRRFAPTSARAGQMALARAGRGHDRDAGQDATGAPLPQSPWLCAAHAVPRLRAPHRLPAMHGLVGGAPLSAPAHLPSLRLCAADPGEMPQVRGARRFGGLRTRRGADRRGGGRALSTSAQGAALIGFGAVVDR